MNATQTALLTAVLLSSLSTASATCFIVYDKAGKVVYQGMDSPADLSRQIHDTLDIKYPNSHLVFTLEDSYCSLQTKANQSTQGVDVTETKEDVQIALSNLNVRFNGASPTTKNDEYAGRNQLRDGFR